MSERDVMPILVVEAVTKHFSAERHFRREAIRAVDGVDLEVYPGEVVSLVGESGSGKTTLARCILGLERPSSGRIRFEGIDVAEARGRDRLSIKRGMQPVFQDPMSSLDPTWSVRRSVREALDVQGIGEPTERDARVEAVLAQVGLPARFAAKRPRELSSGQLQRVCIAAALAPRPRLLVADEPVTALDVSVQAQVLNLLHEIQRELALAMLIVAHDLGVVAHISNRVAVIYGGRIVETGTTAEVFEDPRHPYTMSLLAARPGFRAPASQQIVTGPIAAVPEPGCRYRSRCRYAIERCALDDPSLTAVSETHAAACHVQPRRDADERPLSVADSRR